MKRRGRETVEKNKCFLGFHEENMVIGYLTHPHILSFLSRVELQCIQCSAFGMNKYKTPSAKENEQECASIQP